MILFKSYFSKSDFLKHIIYYSYKLLKIYLYQAQINI